MDKNNLGPIGPRKLSRGKSGLQGARAFLSRRYSVNRSETLDQHHPANNSFFNKHDNPQPKGKERERPSLDEFIPPPRPFFPMRSIIPDPLSELPTWFKTDEIVFSTAAQYRARYPMHNPVGPRRYRNHHLGPASLEKRPPSVFSPSFPPMAATADRPLENKLPGPSRTPSGSPLPTPSSSQTRIHDVRGRTRKLSQTAHDGVDMLDVTDPWGTNWHHQSPYDVGHNPERVSPESSEPPTATTTTMSRPRRMSLTTGGTRHKTVTPSPLSQSTSAVHLAIDPPPPHMPRRLSKTRKPFRGLFGGSFDAGHIHKPDVESSLKRGLSLGATVPSSASSTTTDKREKRASFMGRLVKRFSVMRKTDSSRTSMTGSHDHDHHTVSTRPSVDLHPSTVRNTPSPTKPDLRHVKSVDTARQVPPPQVQDEASQSTTTGAAQKDRDSQSVSSIEANYSIGRLTIANPDDPSPTPTSPMNSPTPLPSVSERAIEVDTFRQRHERPQQILEVPMSSSPPSLDSPVDSSPFPVPSRLSTILSADHPESSIAPSPSPSPPLPDLPPVTPAVAPVPIPESPLPPSPQPTRPPSPIEKTSTTYAPSPPASPRTSPSMGTNGRDALSNGMLPSVSSSARLSIPSVPSMEDSPLSRASMIANPPTPHPPAIVIPAPTVSTLPVPQIQPHHSQDSQRSQESTSKKNGSQRVKNSSGSTKIRQTETFRLARSPSGNVHGGGQGFVAEGELWEVIETPTEEKRSRREKSKSKDKEREKDKEQEKDKGKEREREKVSGSGGATTSRRESKKHDRGNTEDDSEHQKGRHRRSVNDRHDHSSSSPTPPTRTSSSETPQRPSNSERRRSSTKDRESRGDSVRSTQIPRSYIDKPQPTPPTITSSGSRRDQRMSGSAPTRPSSEFQSTHDVNALKAKEAWDLERLWKGRSMVYGPDGAAFLSTRPTIGSDSRPSTIMSADIHRATSIPSVSDLHRASTMPAPTHGSNHTYFVVQGTSPNMPNGQYPPIIYSPPQSPPDSSGQIPYSRREYPKTHRSFSEHIPFPSPDLSPPRRPLANPLPEPPRLSSYTPSPLPESLVGSTEGTSSPDYWTKYAGVTTTH